MLKIYDDFLANPLERREAALKTIFVPYNDNGAIFPGIGLTQHERDLEPLGFTSENSNCINFFRLTLATDILPTYIHTDVAMAEYTGILYLNETGAPESGTRFWKHKATGLTRIPSLQEAHNFGGLSFLNLIEKDGLDESKWECVETIEGKFNRFLLFDSNLFHSPFPRAGWGDSVKSGRLIEVYFIMLSALRSKYDKFSPNYPN